MSLTIETELKDIFTKIEKQFEKIDQRFEKMDESLTDLKLGQVEIKGEIKNLETKIDGLSMRAASHTGACNGLRKAYPVHVVAEIPQCIRSQFYSLLHCIFIHTFI
jgi:archaellum component FlaC